MKIYFINEGKPQENFEACLVEVAVLNFRIFMFLRLKQLKISTFVAFTVKSQNLLIFHTFRRFHKFSLCQFPWDLKVFSNNNLIPPLSFISFFKSCEIKFVINVCEENAHSRGYIWTSINYELSEENEKREFSDFKRLL